MVVWKRMEIEIYWIWTMLFLVFCTFTDIKKRIIYGWFCVANIILGVVMHIAMCDMETKSLLLGVALGAIFMITSALTKEKLGYGDSIVFLATGVIMGGEKSFLIIFWSFFACSLFSVVAILCKKLSLKSSLPFMPFVLVGAIITYVSCV